MHRVESKIAIPFESKIRLESKGIQTLILPALRFVGLEDVASQIRAFDRVIFGAAFWKHKPGLDGSGGH